MISQVESLMYTDKQGAPEEARRIYQPKHDVATNNDKDENSLKNHKQNNVNHYHINQLHLFSILAPQLYSTYQYHLPIG